jgi:hypothetical protein
VVPVSCGRRLRMDAAGEKRFGKADKPAPFQNIDPLRQRRRMRQVVGRMIIFDELPLCFPQAGIVIMSEARVARMLPTVRARRAVCCQADGPQLLELNGAAADFRAIPGNC